MKKRNRFLSLWAAAAVLLAACSPAEQPVTPDPSQEPDPVPGELRPILSASDVTLEATGGTYSIPYTLQNPIDGEKVTATTMADWIYGLTVKEGEVSFDVDHNFREEVQATVTLSYKNALAVNVTVTQPRFDFPEFDLSVKDVGYNTATAVITPKSHKTNYFFEILSVSATNKKIGLDTHKPGEMGYGEALYQDDLDFLKRTAEANNLSLHMTLHHLGGMYKMTENGEPTEMPYSTLSPGVDYFLIVYGMDHDGNRTSAINFFQFSTKSVVMSDQTLSGSMSKITQNGGQLNITSSDQHGTFYWTYVDESDYQTYDLKTIADNMMKNLSYDWSQNYAGQMTYGEYLGYVLDKGSANYSLTELLMGTTYHILAWGVNMEGYITTEIFEIATFTTLVPEVKDDCTFDIQVLKTESMDIQVRVTPSNPQTRYYVAFIDDARYSKFNDYQMVNKIIDMENGRMTPPTTWANTPELFTGTQDIWGRKDLQWRFDPEKTYRVYAFGIDAEGTLSTGIARLDATTGSPEASAMTITANLVESTWHTVKFHITPDNNEEFYMPFLTTREVIDSYRYKDGSLMEDAIMAQIMDIYEDEANQYVYQGPIDYETTWLPDTEYTLLVFGYAGTNTTPMYDFTFRSPAIPFDKASCDLSYTYELFMGKDLKALNAEMWSRYEDDDCVMKINIQTTGDPAHWYWGIWPPKENFATSGGIAHLMSLIVQPELSGNNLVDKRLGFLRPWWYGCDQGPADFVTEDGEQLPYRPWSITAYAEDADGNFGSLHYDLFIPIPKPKAEVTGKYEVGVSEAYDFWSAPASADYIIATAPRLQ